MLIQKICYTNFHESFLQDGTPQVLYILKSYLLTVRCYYVNNGNQFTRKTAIPQYKFLDLVHLVLTTTWYTFNSQFYQQTDDVAIRGPASSTTAEIYMQAYERTTITTALHPPKVWE